MQKLVVKVLALAALLGICFGTSGAMAQADSYPTRPIKLIIPFVAGGPADVVGRILAERVGKELGQPFVVDNRPGANSVIGTQLAARAEADGYSIVMVTGSTVIVMHFLKDKPYDLWKDFVPIIGIGGVPNILVVPGKSELRSLADVIKQGQTPSGINYASGGVGSLAHLSGALLSQELKIKGTHVPYKGNFPALQDIVAGRVDVFMPTPIEALEVIKSGDVRVLGIANDKRIAALPDVPTMKELGYPQINPRIWYGFLAPGKTPQPIVDKLNSAFAKAMADPAVQARLTALTFETAVTTGPEFSKFMQDESARWKKVIDDNHITAEN